MQRRLVEIEYNSVCMISYIKNECSFILSHEYRDLNLLDDDNSIVTVLQQARRES